MFKPKRLRLTVHATVDGRNTRECLIFVGKFFQRQPLGKLGTLNSSVYMDLKGADFGSVG
jgi:hypothetical protein